jgi:hypothetical protein
MRVVYRCDLDSSEIAVRLNIGIFEGIKEMGFVSKVFAIERCWTEERRKMDFRANVFGSYVKGRLLVKDTEVELDVILPGHFKNYERTIKGEVEKGLDYIFDRSHQKFE